MSRARRDASTPKGARPSIPSGSWAVRAADRLKHSHSRRADGTISRKRSHEYDEQTLALIAHAYAEGESLRSIARALNSLHVPTPRGGQWQATSVGRAVEWTARAADLPNS